MHKINGPSPVNILYQRFTGCNGLQWISEAGPAPQLDFHEDERLRFLVQNTMTSEIRFHALLVEGRTG